MVAEGYKQTEIGVIPEDWGIKFISEVASIQTGSKNTQDKSENGQYPFFVRSQTIENINSYSFDGEAVLTAGDGVGTGKVFHYINGKFDYHQRVYNIYDFKIEGIYFYQYFKNNFYNRVMSMTAKSSVDSVRKDMIDEMMIPIPPKQEQQAIATALSDTDALINALEKLIAKKEAIKTGTMQELLTGKKRLDGFSGEWVEKKLGDIVHVVSGGTPSTTISAYWDGTINWYTPTEIGKNKYVTSSLRKLTDEGYQNSSAKILPIGTILFTSRAGIGDTSILLSEGCTNQGFQSLVAKTDIDNEFVYYLTSILKNKFLQNASGSTFLEISPNKVRQIEIFIPSYQEQTAIATILSDMDKEIEALKSKLSKVKVIKEGMMQELLTGKTRLLNAEEA